MQYLTIVCTQPGQALYGFPFDVPLPNAGITVYAAGTTTLATLFDKTGGALSNPFSADVNGIGKFAAANGVYDIQVQSADGTYAAPLIESQQLFDFSDIAGISNLSALGSTGVIARTGATGGVSTYAARTIAGAAGKIAVTNGDGVAGNPTIAISAGAIGNTELAAGAATANIGYTPENAANKSTDGTLAANSDTNYPSQKAVKTYVDAAKASATGLAVGGDLIGNLPNPALGKVRGVALSTDTLEQGQSYLYDSISNSLKARSIEGINYLINPAFDIWQENTSYAISTASARVFVADGWKVAANSGGGSGYTASRAAGIQNSEYAIKFQRVGGDTHGTKIRLVQQLGTADSMFLAGKSVVLSFDWGRGANYSQTSGPFVSILCGTGFDEDVALNVGTANFATGGSTIGLGAATFPVSPVFGAPARGYSNVLAIPVGTTELAIVIASAAAVGTAGADDSFTIANVKLEIGNIATHFRKLLAADEMVRAQRHYRKTFLQATVPAQSIGTGKGEFISAATKAAANAQTLGTFDFGISMRAVPAATTFNPAGTNAEVRDLTAGADCSSTTVQNITESACEIVTTGNASTAVGNRLGVHLVLDARL